MLSRLTAGTSRLVDPVIGRYWIPAKATIWSKGATSRPASTARARVTVNRAAGSKFISKSSCGDVVVVLGAEVKLIVWFIVPRGMPKAETEDETDVTSRAALNGLDKDTVTWLMLFSVPVVGKTEKEVSWHAAGVIKNTYSSDRRYSEGSSSEREERRLLK